MTWISREEKRNPSIQFCYKPARLASVFCASRLNSCCNRFAISSSSNSCLDLRVVVSSIKMKQKKGKKSKIDKLLWVGGCGAPKIGHCGRGGGIWEIGGRGRCALIGSRI